MDTYFDRLVSNLRKRTAKLSHIYEAGINQADQFMITMPEDFQIDFSSLVDQVNLSLMEDKDNFYGYFLFQMSREIRYDISSPTAVNFKGSRYVIYFNPLIFLKLTLGQMKTSMKHEILHILSMHLPRANKMKSAYSKLALNMAMDIVVNEYLHDLPPFATTLESVNLTYSLKLKPYQPLEYYVVMLQEAIDLQKPKSEPERKNLLTLAYDIEKTHDIWEESTEIDEKTMKEFTEKVIELSEKGEIPAHVQSLISLLKNSIPELPWNIYLNRLMGTIESTKKKTTTRRNRRQPERLELRGQLTRHKANVIVALDISASMSDEEYRQAIKEVLGIVKNYNQEITILECDNELRRIYKVKSKHDIKDRIRKKGGTQFHPVFEYANQHKANLLVYFTDGKGEETLIVPPRGYHVLWIISGRGEGISLKNPYGVVKKLGAVTDKDTTQNVMELAKSGFSMMNQENFI